MKTLLAAINDTPCFMWVVCNKLTTVWAPTKKLLVSWQFSGPYGVTKYGSGWRKDVVNQCLEFEPNLLPGHRHRDVDAVVATMDSNWLFSRSWFRHFTHLAAWLKCCFTSTETVGLLGPGAQDGHLDFHTVPEFWSCSHSMNNLVEGMARWQLRNR